MQSFKTNNKRHDNPFGLVKRKNEYACVSLWLENFFDFYWLKLILMPSPFLTIFSYINTFNLKFYTVLISNTISLISRKPSYPSTSYNSGVIFTDTSIPGLKTKDSSQYRISVLVPIACDQKFHHCFLCFFFTSNLCIYNKIWH